MNVKMPIHTLLLFCIAINTIAQKPVYPKPGGKDQIAFGKKLPPPVLSKEASMMNLYKQKTQSLPATTFDKATKKFITTGPGIRNPQTILPLASRQVTPSAKTTASNFHLVKDVNSLSESYPSNY